MSKVFKPYEVVEVISKNLQEIQKKYDFLEKGHKIGTPFELQEDSKGKFFEFLTEEEIVRVYVKEVDNNE